MLIHLPMKDKLLSVMKKLQSATEYRFFLKGLSSHVADKEQGHSCGEALLHVLNQVGQIQQYHLNGLKRNIVHMGHFEAEKLLTL